MASAILRDNLFYGVEFSLKKSGKRELEIDKISASEFGWMEFHFFSGFVAHSAGSKMGLPLSPRF